MRREDPCDDKECRAGRECVVVEGEAQCLCVVSCPDHLKPVCGSDGVSYDNHCKLHQKACISGNHIRIKHKGNCKSYHNKLWKKSHATVPIPEKDNLEDKLQNDLISGLRKDERKKTLYRKGPAACYGPQRNALRFLIVEHFEDDLKKQSWHLEGMTYREGLWGWFFSCDKDKDQYLNSVELFACAKEVNFFARPGQDNELTKELCISVLVDDGDRNRDLKLDFEEFTTIMDPKYEPKEKKCSLRGRNYLDGEEIVENCNECVCAVGNWICAPTRCKETETKQKPIHNSVGHKIELSNDIGFPVESSNDVVDHVEVADLWMENNQKDKEKAKKAKQNKEEFDIDDNLFTDFDQDVEEKKGEKKELHMDDYYDDLYEKTKEKNHKKKIFQLEKALKEVKALRKKTTNLQKLLHNQKPYVKKHEKPQKDLKSKINPYQSENVHVERIEKQKPRKGKHDFGKGKKQKSDKYYDEIFKKTKWNDLIDWGDWKKLKNDKDFELQNHL
ncbi:Follistatin-related protein 1 [Armadillidium nasatum]|uniref:Follistatin-related protein 1 n=1 Tax=Armadillidium nasatum TaxID=96803 RepID=A0A5N5SR00_9CRUS|nr:Follistatin-related protein 1 [Armadillidium nasatum]